MAGTPYKRRTSGPSGPDAGDILANWANTIAKVGILAIAIAYGYYAWAIVGGYLSRPVDARVMSNLQIMGTVLIVAGGLGSVCFLLLTLDEVAWAVVAGGAGAGLLFGTPVLIASYARGAQTQSVEVVARNTALAGEIVLALVILRVFYEIGTYIRTGPRTRTQEEKDAEKLRRKGAVTAKVWARCWDMPYCHEFVREECPAYKAHKTCWRFGYGCMCHPKLIETLIRASAGGASAVAKARQSDYVRSDLEADAGLKPDERTIPCSKCAIFAEHQRQKFRIVNPIVVVGTIVGLAVGYKPVMALYTAFLSLVSGLAARFTLTDNVDPSQWFRYLDSPTVKIFFYVILGTLLLAYLLKTVEYLVLTKKWV